jgi:hypothetical protein
MTDDIAQMCRSVPAKKLSQHSCDDNDQSMDIEIRLCRADEEAASWAIEREVWKPFNWEADGAVGVDYDPQLHLVAVENEQLVATIDACGFAWNGDPDTLPDGGWTDVVLRARDGFDEQPTYACAVGASILPAFQASGLSRQLLAALRETVFSAGYQGLIAPVRPVARWRMPQLDIGEYVRVRLDDGRHFDPWVRTHESLGGVIIGTSPDSAVFGGERAQWQQWAGIPLPDNGDVLIDGAIGWLELHDGYGILKEDSVWVLHQSSQTTADIAVLELAAE